MIDGVELQKVSFGQNPPKIDRIWAEKDNLGDDFNGAQVNDCLLKSYLMLWDYWFALGLSQCYLILL